MTLQPLVAPLFVPADRPDRFAKAAAARPDAVIIDLEDAVDSGAKDFARESVRAVAALDVPIVVRVNAIDGEIGRADLNVVGRMPSLGLMIPKAEDSRAIEAAIRTVKPERTILIIETAVGLECIEALARVPGVSQLAFGPADFCRDLGCDNHVLALLHARGRLVLASRAAGILAPLDGPVFSINDAPAIDAAGKHAKALGFAGMLCIHPAQLAAVRAAFSPTPAQLDWARGVVAKASNSGAFVYDGQMIDGPIVARARAIIASGGT